MKQSVAALSMLVLFGGCLLLLRRAASDKDVQQITIGTDVRRYILYVPKSYSPANKVPLVVVLHGGGGNGRGAAKMTGFSQKADREGFLVLYPYGWGRFDETLLTWNAGNCCGRALDESKNDVQFIRQLVLFVKNQYSIDERRIFATGMSNGAMMSYRLACELPDVFAAVAPVAGALNTEPCRPSQPVGVVIVHGRADQHVLYSGGAPEKMADSHPRVDKSVGFAADFFSSHNGCNEASVQRRGKLEIREFTCARAGLRVYSLDGEGHTWPGGERGYFGADSPSTEFSATDAAWSFFAEHPKP